MSVLADIFAAVRLQLDGTGFEAQATALADKSGKNVGDKMSQQVSGRLRKATGAAIGAGVGIGISQAMQSTQAFGAFEQRMNEVFTLLPDLTQTAMDQMTADVKGFAMETGNTTEKVVQGLYQAISAGVPEDNVFEFLRTANMAAKAGVATTEEAVSLLTAVTKGYGDTSAEAVAKVGDLAFQTVKLGKTTFPELSAAMGKVIPVAATMGVAQEELFGAMATLTGVTGNTSEVVTQLQGSMVALLKPNADMIRALESLGYTGAEAGKDLIGEKGLVGALRALSESSIAGEKGIGKLFRNAESLPAIFALTGAQAEVFNTKLAEMYDAAGVVPEAFERMESGVQAQAEKFAATMEVMGLELGGFLSKFGPLPLIIAQTFGPSFSRTIGAALGGLGGMIAASISATAPQSVAASSAVGTASGTAFSVAASAAIVALPVVVTWALVQQNNEESKERANRISEAVRDIIVTGTADGQAKALRDLRVMMKIEEEQQSGPLSFVSRLFGSSDEREQIQADIDALSAIVEAGGGKISQRFIAGAEQGLEGFDWSTAATEAGVEMTDWTEETGESAGMKLTRGLAAGINKGKSVALAAWRALMDDRNSAANAADQLIINNAEIRAAKKVLADKHATKVEKAEARIRLRNLRASNIDLKLEAFSTGTKLEQIAKLKAAKTSEAMDRGLKSKDPQIKQHWTDLNSAIDEKLGELESDAGDRGEDAASALLTGLKSKNAAILKQAQWFRDHIFANKPMPKASGGPVLAGMPYIVGENRPELFIPTTDGTILPYVPTGFSDTRVEPGTGGSSGGAAGMTFVYAPTYSTASPGEAQRFAQSVAPAITRWQQARGV